ncbi:hypothetical protein SD307_05770 [Staphylococcus sp. KG4-1]|nr:hypothetical protein [Staphylococcus sp. KG4-1]
MKKLLLASFASITIAATGFRRELQMFQQQKQLKHLYNNNTINK